MFRFIDHRKQQRYLVEDGDSVLSVLGKFSYLLCKCLIYTVIVVLTVFNVIVMFGMGGFKEDS